MGGRRPSQSGLTQEHAQVHTYTHTHAHTCTYSLITLNSLEAAQASPCQHFQQHSRTVSCCPLWPSFSCHLQWTKKDAGANRDPAAIVQARPSMVKVCLVVEVTVFCCCFFLCCGQKKLEQTKVTLL